MILLFHILVALGSMAQSTYMYFNPSARQLQASYGLVGLTLASGTYLVVSSSGHLLQSCMMGLFYLGVVSVGIISTQRTLARETIRHSK